MHKYLLLFLLLGNAYSHKLYHKQMFTLHKWTTLNLAGGPEAEGISNPLPVDIDIEYGDYGRHRTFVTIPRLSTAIPYTLATVAASDNVVELNPKLQPFPNMAWHIIEGNNCTGITSAIRTFIDECWRLWIVDSGQVNSLQICPPQILAFDLINDVLLQRYTLPQHIYVAGVSIFTALTVDVPQMLEHNNKCIGGMVYIADSWGYGLIVYDALTRHAWRIEHEAMLPVEGITKFSTPHAGIFTVSISPADVKNRQLYFHTLNSFYEMAIPLEIVNNVTYWVTAQQRLNDLEPFRVVGNRGIQCESEAMDSAGNLFCSLIGLSALVSWKEGTNYTADGLRAVAYNPAQFKFITGLKINKNSLGEDELWALSSEPKLFMGASTTAVRAEDIKFQLIGCRIKNLLKKEPCSVGAMNFRIKT